MLTRSNIHESNQPREEKNEKNTEDLDLENKCILQASPEKHVKRSDVSGITQKSQCLQSAMRDRVKC